MNAPRRPWLLVIVAFSTVFLANAAIMTVELVAGRVVSPYLGMSLYTWTSVIGVVMAGMSAGHYLGGWLADRRRARATLGLLFLLGAAGAASILATNHWAGHWGLLRGMAWPARIFAHTGLMFFPPAMLLGAISPVVAKMALYAGKDAGRVMGGVFASGVAGSIVGTFLTGFYLVVTFPVPMIVGVSAGVLAIVGLLYLVSSRVWPEPAPARFVPSQHVTEAGRGWRFAEWFPPNATVFLSNFAFMAIEIAALRMVTRTFGASLYTWTSVIGIVLAGITLGNALGGRLAARLYGATTVMAILVSAALLALITPYLSVAADTLLADTYALMTLPWPMQILLYTALAFFIPNVALGMVSPVVVKRALNQGHAAGATVGNIYAWGAIGSITATFLTGYALIDWLGPRTVIVVSALALALAGAAYRPRHALPLAAAAASVLALLTIYFDAAGLRQLGERAAFRAPEEPGTTYEDESQYSYIAVREDPENPNLRTLVLDTLVHSTVNLEDPLDLRYEYEQIYQKVLGYLYPGQQPIRSLVMGGGGYAFPHYLEKARPGSYVEVAEIDPAVTEAAFEALGLPRGTDIAIYDQDARNRVEDLLRAQQSDPDFVPFDCIFGDSLNDYTVPYHLTTLEFTQDLHALLKPGGVYMLNCIDVFASGQFVGALRNTLEAVFETVYVFNTYRTPTMRDTFVLVACKSNCDLEPIRHETTMLPENMVAELEARSGGVILTDRYAPVENLLAPVVRTQGGKIGEIHFEEAKRAAETGNAVRALAEAEKAVEIHPVWPRAWVFIAEQREALGDQQGALEAWQRAIEGSGQLPAAHHRHAQALFANGQFEAAAEAWGAAARLAPGNVNYWYNTGLAFAALNDLEKAIEAWRQALQANPKHLDTLYNLIVAYIGAGQPERARESLEAFRAAGGEPSTELVQQVEDLPSSTS